MRQGTICKAVLLVALVAALGACKKKEEMGPAQKAGAAIDNAGDQIAKDIHAKLDKADQAAKDMAEAAKATGDKIKDATEDASKGLDKATEEVGKKVEKAGEKIQDAARK
jgi:hypothetical protein